MAKFHENCNLMKHLYASFSRHNWNLLMYSRKIWYISVYLKSLRIYTPYCQQFGIYTHTDTMFRILWCYCICMNITMFT